MVEDVQNCTCRVVSLVSDNFTEIILFSDKTEFYENQEHPCLVLKLLLKTGLVNKSEKQPVGN